MISSNSHYQNQGYLVIYNCLQNQRDELCREIRRIPNLLRKCKKVQTVSVINIGQLNVMCKSCKRVTLVRSSTLLIYFNLRNQEKYSDPSLFVTTDLKTFIIKEWYKSNEFWSSRCVMLAKKLF